MEYLELIGLKYQEVNKLIMLAKEREALTKAIFPSNEPELTKAYNLLHKTNGIGVSLRTNAPGVFTPIFLLYTKNRLDSVWNYLLMSQILSQWKSYIDWSKNISNNQPVYFEMSVPHKFGTKEFYESDTNQAFKKIRRLPGWRRCVLEGKFYTSFKKTNDQIFVTTYCVAVCNPNTKKSVFLRYLKIAWGRAMKLKVTDKADIEVRQNLTINNELNYLKQNGQWNFDFIKKLIKKGCLEVPKLYGFGGFN